MLILAGIGGAIELIQPQFGRGASWRDFGIDILGALLGLAFIAPARRQIHHQVLLCAQLCILVITAVAFYGPLTTLWDMWQASRKFPILSDFETCYETIRWSNGEIDRNIARQGKCSLKVVLNEGKYPGTTLTRSFGDWRGFTAFAFSLYLPDKKPLRITVSIRDHEHNQRGGEFDDRYNRTFTMKQGWNDIVIPIPDILNAPAARELNIGNLSEVVFFTTHLINPRIIYLDNIHLQGFEK